MTTINIVDKIQFGLEVNLNRRRNNAAKQATEKLSVKYEERAVGEFMKKVDNLQNQINELHNHYE